MRNPRILSHMQLLFDLSPGTLALLALLFLWVTVIKGYALWTAARHNHKFWFIFFLFFQTLGILELIYIFMVYRKEHPEGTK